MFRLLLSESSSLMTVPKIVAANQEERFVCLKGENEDAPATKCNEG